MAALEHLIECRIASLYQAILEVRDVVQDIKESNEDNQQHRIDDYEEQIVALRMERDELKQALAVANTKLESATNELTKAQKEVAAQKRVADALRSEITSTAENMISRSRVVGATFVESDSWEIPCGDYRPGFDANQMETEQVLSCPEDQGHSAPPEAGEGW